MSNDLTTTAITPEQRRVQLNNAREEFTLFRGESLKQIETLTLKMSAIQEVTADNLPAVKELIKEERKLKKQYGDKRLWYTNKIKEFADGVRATEDSDWKDAEEHDKRLTALADAWTKAENQRIENERKRIEFEARRNADIESIKIQLETLFSTTQADRVHKERELIGKTLKTIVSAEDFDKRIKNLPGYIPKLQQVEYLHALTSRVRPQVLNPDEVGGIIRAFVEQDLHIFEVWSGLVLEKVEDLKKEYIAISGSYKEKLEAMAKEAQEKAIIANHEAQKEIAKKTSEAQINANIEAQAKVQALPTVNTTGSVRALFTGELCDWQKMCELYIEKKGGIGDLAFMLTFLVKQNCPDITGIKYEKEVKASFRGK